MVERTVDVILKKKMFPEMTEYFKAVILRKEDKNIPFKGVLKSGNGGQVFSSELF